MDKYNCTFYIITSINILIYKKKNEYITFYTLAIFNYKLALFSIFTCEHHLSSSLFLFWSSALSNMVVTRKSLKCLTVEPCSMDTRILWTVLSVHMKSSHISSKITLLNMDNRHFSVSWVTNSHTSSTPLYGHWLSAHCLFPLSQLCQI